MGFFFCDGKKYKCHQSVWKSWRDFVFCHCSWTSNSTTKKQSLEMIFQTHASVFASGYTIQPQQHLEWIHQICLVILLHLFLEASRVILKCIQDRLVKCVVAMTTWDWIQIMSVLLFLALLLSKYFGLIRMWPILSLFFGGGGLIY